MLSGLTAAWKLIGLRGAIGLVAALALSVLLALQVHKTHHWQSESGKWQTAYGLERQAFQQTVANYRAAADEAKRLDAANAARVRAEQSTINQESDHAFQARLAAARADAARLREKLATAAAHPGGRTGAPVPGVPPAASGPAQGASDDLSWRLRATEQAIQLDELIKWVRKQASVNVNGPASQSQGPKP
jgi:hypothetical protein